MKKLGSAALMVSLLVSTPVLGADPSPHSAVSVSFRSIDGLMLAATYCPPVGGHGVLLMLHGLDSNRSEWGVFSAAAQAAGWGTLAYDARGHGETVSGKAKGFRAFGPAVPGSQWDRMPDDLDAAVRFLNGKGIKTHDVSILGASLGANVAVKYCARGGETRALVLMSPGLNYAEFRPDNDFPSVKAPRLIIVSPADRYAYASSVKLASLAPGTDLWTDVTPGHGVQMFSPNEKGKNDLADRLLAWLSAR